MSRNTGPTPSPKTPEPNIRVLPDTTPRSNFSISPPKVLTSSSSSDSSDEDNVVNNDSPPSVTSSRVSRITGLANNISSESNTIIGEHGSIHSSVLRRRRLRQEGRTEDEDDVDSRINDTVLAFVWGAGKLGAAYYDVGTSQLHLLPDITECAPDYLLIRSLFSQVMPKYVIASQRQDQRMIHVLKDLCGDTMQEDLDKIPGNGQGGGNTNTEGEGAKLILLPGKEFAPDACRERLRSMKLAYEPDTNDNSEHLIFIASLIPFNNEVMTRAAGALLKFLDVAGISLLQLELVESRVHVLDVVLIAMSNLVMVDNCAWNSLQIFNVDLHPSSNKVGTSAGSKEGISLYSWLNKCTSLQGSKYLRMMLLRPTRDPGVLNRRYDVIEFCTNPCHLDFTKAANDCMKAMKNTPKLLFKISLLNGTAKDWKDLYQTVYHSMLLGEICAAQSTAIELFCEISSAPQCSILRQMSQELLRVINFDESMEQGRLVVNAGIDPELDSKKKQFDCLPDVMSMVAAEEVESLPESINQCAVVYLPEIGYLLCVTLTEEETNLAQVPLMPGFQFMFRNHDAAYYKSPRTRELDVVVGDCQVSILDRETYIMIQLSDIILKNSQLLIKTGILVAELDCLMAIARVSAANSYIRPKIVPGHGRLVIDKGRHPLLEQLCDYMPNSTSLSDDKKACVLTGPNASGKSIYLKQVGAIVLMALSGIFVPADFAEIPAYDRICTRIHTIESVSSGMSSFMMDISQMSLALRTATKESLVLIDEFGKGTAEADGLSLLAASLRDFLGRKEKCPTIFLSTHFYSLVEYLDPSTPFKLQTMEYIKEGNQIVYLFKLKDGSSQSSFATLVAAEVGIPIEIIRRSNEIERVVRNQYQEAEKIIPVDNNRKVREEIMVNIGKDFLIMDLHEIDPSAYLSAIGRLLGTDDKENVAN